LDDAFALLRLQLEWGADEAIDLAPLDRLRPVESRPAPRPRPAPVAELSRGELPRGEIPRGSPSGSPSGSPGGSPGERALGLAGQATTLEELRAAVAGFDGCALRDTASNLVFAEGDPTSFSLLIGDPPGREEDRSGHPFAGPDGQLLDQMLASIQLTRAELMLTPLLPWRPPGGRPPSPAEVAICLPFLHRLIALLQPRRVVLFGATAARVLLPQSQNRRRNPRIWIELNIPGMQSTLPAVALPGLAEMVKNPPLRRDAWAGLRLLRRAIELSQM
jgi:uracil-DNA glycosylase family 4